MKTPVLESLFNTVAGLEACDFIKKIFQHRCFPVNNAKLLRTPEELLQTAAFVALVALDRLNKKFEDFLKY